MHQMQSADFAVGVDTEQKDQTAEHCFSFSIFKRIIITLRLI